MSSEYVSHMWHLKPIGRFKPLKNCHHCGKNLFEYESEKNLINEKFLSGEISIEEQKAKLKAIEKCLTRDEAVVKDLLT